jgi:hypothetical protein
MIKLDDDLLQQLGLAGLPPEEKKKLLAHIYETLEMRVGMKLAEQMSDAQLTEFEQFIDRNDEAGALKWLETNFPNYKDVVASEFERLKTEIQQVAPQILAASNQGMQTPQPQFNPNPQQTQYSNPPQPQQPVQGQAWQQANNGQFGSSVPNQQPPYNPGPINQPNPWGSQGGMTPPTVNDNQQNDGRNLGF